ncbi:hypothetical protein [uncultured Kordia sp.]|uniref:hypothetical protein n=1 Tax=uncultured Kordia sp. TaxID=507699 RepID=UPI0026064EAE|nr:hypothetical protein [uncultured Kordia sp.]
MSTIGLISFSIAIGINSIFLYNRKKRWNTSYLRWLTGIILFIIALIAIYFKIIVDSDVSIFIGSFSAVLIYNTFDAILKTVSMRLHERDFYLWLRGSDEINDSLHGKNPHIKLSDKVFSFFLLILIFTAPFLGYFFKL